MKKSHPLISIIFLFISSVALGNTFTVTILADDGIGSLRQAIYSANSNPGSDLIIFSIAGSINLQSGLPPLNDLSGGTVIDGTSAPGYSGAPVIRLNSGLSIQSSGNSIRALQITSAVADGISIGGVVNQTENNSVSGCFIGTDGTNALPNGRYGIWISANTSYNTIGTNGDGIDDVLERNIISGNNNSGISISNYSSYNTISGNYIGVDVTGYKTISNGLSAIHITFGNNNCIGTNGDGTADEIEGNVISGSGSNGIFIYNGNNNTISGNHIGTNVQGSAALPNSGHGIYINVGNNNIIGTDGNGIGDAAEGNVISGNASNGISLNGEVDDLIISGNLIGVDKTGTIAIKNNAIGIGMTSFDNNIRIGTNGDGISDELERNIISGNRTGISVGNSSVVSGNFIGTDITGTIAIANEYGIALSATSTLIGSNQDGVNDDLERNIISGNLYYGIISSYSNGNTIADNYIGTNPYDTRTLGNGRAGIFIDNGADNAIISNTIAYNGGEGVLLTRGSAIQNRISQNSIFSNGKLGIDLSGSYGTGNGVTVNDQSDPDQGANRYQNFPVINSVYTDATGTTISGSLNSKPGIEYTLEFFLSLAKDPSDYGEGEQFIGSIVVTTDASGNSDFVYVFDQVISEGEFISATAMDQNGNTSEFSKSFEYLLIPLPSAICQNALLDLDANGQATLNPELVDNGSTGSNIILSVTPSTFDCSDVGDNLVTLTVTDEFGNTATCNATVTIVDNIAPEVITQNITIQLDDTQSATILPEDVDGSSSDACGIADATVSPNSFSCHNIGVNTVTLTKTDVNGNIASAEAVVTVLSNAADIISVAGPEHPQKLGIPVYLEIVLNSANPVTVEVQWNDGIKEDYIASSGIVTATHLYSNPGVYSVMISVSGGCGQTSEFIYSYVVIHDPDGGYVTGGGWIDSPIGASTQYPDATGKANFGFVSKYKKGAAIPTGNTEFQFKVGDLNFHSYIYDWLVVAGSKAMFKGEGTINRTGNYGFMISAFDGDLKTRDELDKFRIKIWNLADEYVIYDNQIGDDEGADPITTIGGGSIVIHEGSDKKSILITPESVALSEIATYPNPFLKTATIKVKNDEPIDLKIYVYDIGGRLIENLHEGMIKENISYTFEFTPEKTQASGTYIVKFIMDNNVIAKQLIQAK